MNEPPGVPSANFARHYLENGPFRSLQASQVKSILGQNLTILIVMFNP
jgi:hypothetical protein